MAVSVTIAAEIAVVVVPAPRPVRRAWTRSQSGRDQDLATDVTGAEALNGLSGTGEWKGARPTTGILGRSALRTGLLATEHRRQGVEVRRRDTDPGGFDRSRGQVGRSESGAQAALSCGCRSSEGTLGVTAVSRNPLRIRKAARETSQAKIGTTHTPRSWRGTPNMPAMLAAKTSGPPIRPRTGMKWATSLERYSAWPSPRCSGRRPARARR